MLHGILKEQGNCLDVSDEISQKKSHCTNKFPASGALLFGFIVIADTKPINLC